VNGGRVNIIGNSNYNKRHTIYVDGDAFITNDIKYKSNYTSGIPSFTLVVRGNIYIDKEVSTLDGLYIAQPKIDPSDSTKTVPGTGRVYTCTESANGDPIIDVNAMYSKCGADDLGPPKQLTINGAVLADRIVLNRSGYSLRDSRHKEPANNSKASEIFNFTGEMYLSPPIFQPSNTSTSGEYDYISILAPIL